MSKSQQESHVVAVRLSTEERDSLAALAGIEGKSVSAYVRGLLVGAKSRPRPVVGVRAAVEENARRVITIVRLHGQGTVP